MTDLKAAIRAAQGKIVQIVAVPARSYVVDGITHYEEALFALDSDGEIYECSGAGWEYRANLAEIKDDLK